MNVKGPKWSDFVSAQGTSVVRLQTGKTKKTKLKNLARIQDAPLPPREPSPPLVENASVEVPIDDVIVWSTYRPC